MRRARPQKGELQLLVDAGFTDPRLADHYGVPVRWICKLRIEYGIAAVPRDKWPRYAKPKLVGGEPVSVSEPAIDLPSDALVEATFRGVKFEDVKPRDAYRWERQAQNITREFFGDPAPGRVRA